MTLCKGSQDSIEVGMGVLTENGIAGIVSQVSEDFSTVLMILNSESRTSAKIKNKNHTGNLLWRNSNPRIMTLTDVPKHAIISIGDSIVTSGFSISFPQDVYIGDITDYSIRDGGNSYIIDVELAADLSQTDYVYIVSYKHTDQKKQLLETDE